jgi:hypothetical protein
MDFADVDGETYIALHSNDHQMSAFLKGADDECPTNAGFLVHFRDLRNNAVDTCILDHVRQSDPMCSSLPRNARKLVDPATLPRTVPIKFPAMTVDGVEVPEREVIVLAELVPTKVVSVRMDANMLDTLRAAAIMLTRSGKGPGKRRRRAKGARVYSGYDCIMTNYRRSQFYIMYNDADGLQRQLSEKVKLDSPDDCDRACDLLWEKIKPLHHAEVDGQFVNAFEHKIDIFTPDTAEECFCSVSG